MMLVTPAKAGAQRDSKQETIRLLSAVWVPAFAGMTG